MKKNTNLPHSIIHTILLTIIIFISSCEQNNNQISSPSNFEGDRAYKDVQYQVSLGPRIPDSDAHTNEINWIMNELQGSGWETEIQNLTFGGQNIRNVVGKIGEGSPWIILGAHYDTRLQSDQDKNPDNWSLPVPGANDGASGVAVLLEFARILPTYFGNENVNGESLNAEQIWLVFFDGEDNGRILGRDWALGSQVFVQHLQDMNEFPDSVVIVDMIGDADLNVCREGFSDIEILDDIWSEAEKLGYNAHFITDTECYIRDDHTSFLKAGIPTALLIDFDYPYWHTVDDTIDKVSATSLQVIGQTILEWLTD